MPPRSPLMVSVPGSLPFRCSITHTGGAGPRCPRARGTAGGQQRSCLLPAAEDMGALAHPSQSDWWLDTRCAP